MRRPSRHCPVALLLAIAFVAPAGAWVRDNIPALWPDGTVTMHLQLNHDGNRTLSDGTTWNTTAQAALEEWNRFIGRVQFAWVPGSSASLGANNNVSNVHFSPAIYGESWGSHTVGVAITWHSNGVRRESDVLLNANRQWDSYRGPVRWGAGGTVHDARRVLLHEFGHVLGLGHPDEAGQSVWAVMNSTIGDRDQLTEDDQDGGASLYGHGAANPPQLPTIHNHPFGRSVVAGEAVFFGVAFGGRPQPTVQWYKDGQPIPGATGATYRIDSARVEDAGIYHAAVSNVAGTVLSNPAELKVTPAQPPQFLVTPAAVEIEEGNDLWVNYAVSGTPPLTHTWRRGDRIVRQGINAHLPSNLGPADSGEYTLEVSNVAGSVVSPPFTITILPGRPPRFTLVEGTVRALRGQTVTLTAAATGSGHIRYLWRRGGFHAEREGSSYSFPLNSTIPETYRVIATNSLGSTVSEPIWVEPLPDTLGDAPRLVSHTGRVTVPRGGQLELNASAAGGPGTSLAWFRDGQPIPPPRSVGHAGPEHAGRYRVVASNSHGSMQSADIVVEIVPGHPPTVTHHPAPHDLKPGDSVTIAPAFLPPGAASTLSHQWSKDGVDLPVASATLTLNGSAPDVAGLYRVRSTGPNGSVISNAVPIRKVDPSASAYMLRHPADREVPIGGEVDFDVHLRMDGSPSYRWRHNGELIPGATGPHYSISAVQPHHAGQYVVEIEHPGGRLESHPATLAVRPPIPPQIVYHPNHAYALPGATAFLSIHVLSLDSVPVQYRWRRDGHDLPNAQAPFLEISNVGPEHAGEYDCVVSWPGGSAISFPGQLHLLASRPEPPAILRQPVQAAAHLSHTLTLRIDAIGQAPMTYRWRRDGTVHAVTAEPELKLHDFRAELTGTWDVVVANTLGEAVSAPIPVALLEANPVLSIVEHPFDQTAVAGSSVTFSVLVTGPADRTYQWKRNGMPIAGALSSSYTIPIVQFSDEANYSVEVVAGGQTRLSRPARLTVVRGTAPPGPAGVKLVNLATRARVTGGDGRLIVGFVIEGGSGKQLLLRGIGPALQQFGVPDALTNPTLEVRRGDDLVAANDDWNAADSALAAAMTAAGAFALAPGSKDAALLATLPPGIYTAVVASADHSSGVALVELYDVAPGNGRLVNLSTRAHVGTGSDVVIPGVILQGQGQARLLVRAIGPTLANYQLRPEDLLADPVYEVFRQGSAAPLARVETWQSTNPELTDASGRVGAFALPDGSRDAASLIDLGEGLYTVVVRGNDNGSGIALVEVYVVPAP